MNYTSRHMNINISKYIKNIIFCNKYVWEKVFFIFSISYEYFPRIAFKQEIIMIRSSLNWFILIFKCFLTYTNRYKVSPVFLNKPIQTVGILIDITALSFLI